MTGSINSLRSFFSSIGRGFRDEAPKAQPPAFVKPSPVQNQHPLSRLGREFKSHVVGWNIRGATHQMRDAVRHGDLGSFNQSIRAGCLFNKPDHRKLDNPLHEAAKLRPSRRSDAIQQRLIFGTDLHGNHASFEQMNMKRLRPFDIAIKYSNEQFLRHMLDAMRRDPTRNYGTGGSRAILAIRDNTVQPVIRQILDDMAHIQWRLENTRQEGAAYQQVRNGFQPSKHVGRDVLR